MYQYYLSIYGKKKVCSINFLEHASTTTVNSTSGCLHKGVKLAYVVCFATLAVGSNFGLGDSYRKRH